MTTSKRSTPEPSAAGPVPVPGAARSARAASPHPKVAGFGARLKGTRALRALTVRELAGRAGLGVGRVNDLENGSGLPGIETAALLADALDVSPAWLAFGIGRGPNVEGVGET